MRHIDGDDYTYDPPTSGDGKHWEGCWREHQDCARKLYEELKARFERATPRGVGLDAAEREVLELTTWWNSGE